MGTRGFFPGASSSPVSVVIYNLTLNRGLERALRRYWAFALVLDIFLLASASFIEYTPVPCVCTGDSIVPSFLYKIFQGNRILAANWKVLNLATSSMGSRKVAKIYCFFTLSSFVWYTTPSLNAFGRSMRLTGVVCANPYLTVIYSQYNLRNVRQITKKHFLSDKKKIRIYTEIQDDRVIPYNRNIDEHICI